MATTVVKTYSIAPYYDDFDETKNFHRVLFRPGFAVQARELTQLQTALQAQIDRYGQFAFKDGSRVIDGKVTLNVEYDFVKIESSFTHSTAGSLNTDNYLSEFVGTTITGATSGVTAEVQEVVAAVSGGDPNTLYVKYTNSGTNNTTSVFAAGEEFSSNGTPVRHGKVGGGSGSSISNQTGQGSSINIEEGVYFISGTFIFVPGGSLILDKYTNTPNYIVGLTVAEEEITSATDTSLLDNAQGVPNSSAPGANRYRISTTLIKEPLDIASRTENRYITLVRIEDGKTAVDKTDKNTDTELTERLARRTFEESGDYVVEPFQLNIREYLNDGTNFGFKTTAQIIADGDAANTTAATTFGKDRLAIGVEPSVAYVKGFRVQNNTTKYVTVEKPRGTDATNNVNLATTSAQVGNYVKLTASTVKGIPDVNDFTNIDLHSVTIAGTQSNSNKVGTARAKALEIVGSELRLYLFDINMTSGSFSAVKSFAGTGSITPFIGDVAGSTAQLFDVGKSTSIFKLPYSAVKTLFELDGSGNPTSNVDTIYQVKQRFTTTSGSNSISIASGQGTFVNDGQTIIGLGANVIDTSPTISISGNGLTMTISDVGGTTSFSGQQMTIITTVQKGLQHKSKTRTTVSTSAGALSSGEKSLLKADIIKINSVTDANNVDITDQFTLDNGQRDNFYDIGKVILKSGFTVTGNIVVNFDYYEHGSGDYFSVDSYPAADYDTIGSFASIQGVLPLRDCIDFRPRKENAADGGDNDFTGTGASNPQPPRPGSLITAEVTHFMPRIDKLYITRRGEFKTQAGVPDLNPRPPETPSDSMAIYNLNARPFIYKKEDLKPEIIDNRRYTMRDIGSIDKRLKNVEYYTSLSLLEQSAADVDLFDGNNFTRLKNGFIVDGFRGHSVGDPTNPDYKASIDRAAGELRPMFDERNTNLVRKSADSGANVVLNAGIATLPFTETNYINQPYASFASNVNPYNVFTWAGTVELSPDSDEWKETDVRPNVIINDSGSFDQFRQMAEETGILGTVWNEWETNWAGVEVEQTTTSSLGNPGFDFFDFEPELRIARDRGRTGGAGNVTNTTITTTTANQSRSGLRTELAFDTVQRSDGQRVVEVNFVPFIRSRKISFKAQLLKPNTKFFPFFDGTDVSAFAREETFAQFSSSTDVDTFEGETAHPSGSSALISNAAGVIEGSFVIPRNSALQFQTGIREFRLSDDSSNNKDNETSYAEAQYHAQGLREAVESRIVSTRVPRLVQSELNDERTIVDTQVAETTTWVDPVAETILIDRAGGIFAKSVDLFFKTKDASIPVRVTIRTTQNGIPTQRIVPGADKILYPSSINTSANAATATNFAFDFPIYLAQDTEYAIVITSQSDNYEVYVAEMGGFDLTNTDFRISKQPYNGVFFSSQNASTWTPEQSKDLKFKLNRCSFSGSGAHMNLVNDTIPVRKLKDNPFTTTSSSGVVTVTHPNHGMYDTASRVVIAGAVDTNGIAAANLNGTHQITNITHDSYKFTAGGSDTASGSGAGGGTAVTAQENRHMDLIYPVIENIQLPGTSLKLDATTTSAKSVNGSETAYQSQTALEILPNRNFKFNAPKLIASPINETQHLGGAKSFNLKCTFTTTDEGLSPVIDLNRCSIHTIQNIIGQSDSVVETASKGGTELARYITKKVELAEEADVATIFMNVNRPGGSNVRLFHRTLPGGSSGNLEDTAFVEATPVETIPTNDTAFAEVRYDIDPAGSFGSIQFKIVMTSTISSTPPRVRDFRAICAT